MILESPVSTALKQGRSYVSGDSGFIKKDDTMTTFLESNHPTTNTKTETETETNAKTKTNTNKQGPLFIFV